MSQGSLETSASKTYLNVVTEGPNIPTTVGILIWPSDELGMSIVGNLPAEGLILKTPLHAAGMETDPPMSVANPTALPRSAWIAPSPPELPPEDSFWLIGFQW